MSRSSLERTRKSSRTWASSGNDWKWRIQSSFSLSVLKKNPIQPLLSCSRTKAGEESMPKNRFRSGSCRSQTANRDRAGVGIWRATFSSPLDRLTHHCAIHQFDWENIRFTESLGEADKRKKKPRSAEGSA